MKSNRIELEIIGIIVLIMIITLLAGCKKHDPKPSKSEQVTQLLTANGGQWNLPESNGVVVDGIDVTKDLFANFSITFTSTSFSTTGTSPVWLREDTWRFKDDNATVIIRGQDNKEITISEISANQLTLTLKWDQTTYADGGRQRSLAGTYTFTLNK